VEYPDNLNSIFGGQIENRVGEMGKYLTPQADKFTAGSWPRVAQIRELYQTFKDMAQVIKKTGSGRWAIGSSVVSRFFVYIGLGSWSDDKSFRHGGGE
jgi:hypothetical protein